MLLRAPFPWFGGKSRAAPMIWNALGDVPNYVEPFAGSLATLLARPHPAKIETVNDLDCYVANFWRAASSAPDEVARWCDWPVNEADLLARHRWLLAQADFRARMREDADYFDAKIAGWWVWGLCAWIGSGWCVHAAEQLPHVGDAGRGVHRKLPHVGNAGMGVHRKLPHVGNAGRAAWLAETFATLAARLRHVRVACGDWSRVLGDSVTWRHGVTGILLDPPYAAEGHSVTYSADGGDCAGAAAAWAFANGENDQLRIVLCGYADEHAAPRGWRRVTWKAHGGYGSQGNGRGRANAVRETLLLSPYCHAPSDLFTEAIAAPNDEPVPPSMFDAPYPETLP